MLTSIDWTYKIISRSSRVLPLVSGRKKNAQTEARIIQVAKKNQVPYPKEENIYGRALVITNWISLLHSQRS
jgi:hypothetical protein